MSDGVPGGQRNFSVWSILPLSGGVNIIVAKRFSGASPPACRPRRTLPGEFTLHADRGSSMQSKPVALLLADLGVTKTHSRFGSIEDARLFCRNFFGYYNHEHRHSGIGLMTPAVVHHGRAEKLTTARRQTLVQAQRAYPTSGSEAASRSRSNCSALATRFVLLALRASLSTVSKSFCASALRLNMLFMHPRLM